MIRGVGILPVEPAITGAWTFQGFPPAVSLLGTTFVRAQWAWPLYSGVVAQYRQDVPTNAMHLLIYRSGQYVIEHLDEINPSRDPLGHAVVDAPLATSLAVGAIGFGVGLVAGLLLLRD
jgi:hypothetical protein